LWFRRIDPHEFTSQVLQERRAVVLAYVRYDASLAPVVDALWDLRLVFGDAVAVRLLDADGDAELGSRLGLTEVPVFLLYHKGRELARLPGTACGRELATAVMDRGFREIS
jgi:hypothetical protein